MKKADPSTDTLRANYVREDFPGGLQIGGGSAVIAGSTLLQNKGASGGGAMFDGGSALLQNSTFAKNTAVNGGGFFNYSGDVKLHNSTISFNSAKRDGGGVWTAAAVMGPALMRRLEERAGLTFSIVEK